LALVALVVSLAAVVLVDFQVQLVPILYFQQSLLLAAVVVVQLLPATTMVKMVALAVAAVLVGQ
jgi:hypothetical protein